MRCTKPLHCARAKKEEIGERSSLCAQRSRLQEERENILWQLDAIRLAKESLVQAHAELTGRVSPQINKLAEQYLRTLTAERYTAMQLYTDLEATCRRENSAVEMDRCGCPRAPATSCIWHCVLP